MKKMVMILLTMVACGTMMVACGTIEVGTEVEHVETKQVKQAQDYETYSYSEIHERLEELKEEYGEKGVDVNVEYGRVEGDLTVHITMTVQKQKLECYGYFEEVGDDAYLECDETECGYYVNGANVEPEEFSKILDIIED